MMFPTPQLLLPLCLFFTVTLSQRNLHINPLNIQKLYEYNPTISTLTDGWGETSRDNTSPSGVSTLISFQTSNLDAGRPCALRFARPNILLGTNTFSVYNFTTSSGGGFSTKASWGNKGGTRGALLTTHTFIANGPDIVAKFACPAGNKVVNFELVAGAGVSNMQWFSPAGEGLWLEVGLAIAPASTSQAIQIPRADQTRYFEANPSSGFGSTQFGEVSMSAAGLATTTLVAYKLPASPSYVGRTCRLRFANASAATPNGKFALFEFVTVDGQIFVSATTTWANKGGFRTRQLARVDVGGGKEATLGSRYEFLCPPPGKALNYEMVPYPGAASQFTWNSQLNGGLVLEVL